MQLTRALGLGCDALLSSATAVGFSGCFGFGTTSFRLGFSGEQGALTLFTQAALALSGLRLRLGLHLGLELTSGIFGSGLLSLCFCAAFGLGALVDLYLPFAFCMTL